MQGLVFDKDGSLYSASKYINPFAEYLSKYFDEKKFMRDYHDFIENSVIGKKYDPKTLKEDENGRPLGSAFWLPCFIALNHGFVGGFLKEFSKFSDYILNDPFFPFDTRLIDVLSDPSYHKALVSSEDSDELLKKIGVRDLFDLLYVGVKKNQKLGEICPEIETSFSAKPSDIVWVEDDLLVLELLAKKGYKTVLRKTQGFNYVPEQELKSIATLILEDDLTELYNLIKNDK
jgi:FMN phosphatase YigB (HAD superfamily)